jgi:hypothetical protein
MSELAHMARIHLDQKIHRGERDRHCGLPHCSLLVCARLAVDDPDDLTSLRRFKGIPVSCGVSFNDHSPLRSKLVVQTCQPAGVSAHRVVRTCLTVRRVTAHH